MPPINLRKELYDKLIRMCEDPIKFTNDATEKEIKKLERRK